MSTPSPIPPSVREYAEQAVAYVERALRIKLEYDSNTLPVLDHYLRTVPADQPAALALVLATAGAYFGEVVRRHLGGRWELSTDARLPNNDDSDSGTPRDGQPESWRVVLPTGIHFSPAGFVATAVAQADLDDFDSEMAAPPRMLPYLQQALSRMGEVTVEEYYSLCGRLDTLEHVHEVLVAVAAQMMGDAADPDDLEAGDDGAGELPDELPADDAGGVN
jgi:hypothetical protein